MVILVLMYLFSAGNIPAMVQVSVPSLAQCEAMGQQWSASAGFGKGTRMYQCLGVK